jgi:hypothetical protein
MSPLVEFVRNANPADSTSRLTGLEDGDITIGHQGLMTDEEYDDAIATGKVVLRVIDENAEPEDEPTGDDLDGLTKAKLEGIAEEEDIDLSSASNNEDRVRLIRESRSGTAAEPEGAQSLPATAPKPAEPVPPEAGGGGTTGGEVTP